MKSLDNSNGIQYYGGNDPAKMGGRFKKGGGRGVGGATASSRNNLSGEGRAKWIPSNSADIPRSLRDRLLKGEGRVKWIPSDSADIPRSLRNRL